ncbi:MAG: hypothetical protein K9H26_01515 [Prolixibacteraceae bacterium]|nr:hypothetical protein [Prolixibacteraceae bacterium]
MFKAQNIAKIWQRLLPPAGWRGGLGWGLLLILLSAMPRYAHAQNTSDNPYLNSWHQYSVIPMGDAGNTYEWIIYDNEAEAINGTAPDGSDSYELTNALSWVKGRTILEGNAYIEILFDENVNIFSNGATLHLIYAEYSGGACLARRRFDINIIANTFYVTLPANDFTCNSMTGSIWDNAAGVLNIRDEITTVPFTVSMLKADNFTINSWEFTGSFTVTSGSVNNSIHSIMPFAATNGQTSPEGYDWEITGDETSFTLTVTVDDAEVFNTDDVTFEVQLIGDITSDYAVQLSIEQSSVKAYSGSSYIVETSDNGSGSYTQTRTLWGIPNTSVVYVSP